MEKEQHQLFPVGQFVTEKVFDGVQAGVISRVGVDNGNIKKAHKSVCALL